MAITLRDTYWRLSISTQSLDRSKWHNSSRIFEGHRAPTHSSVTLKEGLSWWSCFIPLPFWRRILYYVGFTRKQPSLPARFHYQSLNLFFNVHCDSDMLSPRVIQSATGPSFFWFIDLAWSTYRKINCSLVNNCWDFEWFYLIMVTKVHVLFPSFSLFQQVRFPIVPVWSV